MQTLHPAIWALIGTSFTFLGTAVGAALVFFTKKQPSEKWLKFFLGFAAGVMIAASIWSLIIPAIEMANNQGQPSLLPSCIGIVLGGLFIYVVDIAIAKKNGAYITVASTPFKTVVPKSHRSSMLMIAVTLHNIPEGMAVGLTFALGASSGTGFAGFVPAIIMACGMAIQNLPEGAAISLPLKSDGYRKSHAFLYGAASGIVEPIAGVLGVLIGATTILLMPWLLSFAAGAMFYVVIEELIPESQNAKTSHVGTIGAFIGFVVMMAFDIAFG